MRCFKTHFRDVFHVFKSQNVQNNASKCEINLYLIYSFRNQPQQLARNPDYETTEDDITETETIEEDPEDEDTFRELQTKQRENFLNSRPYLTAPVAPSSGQAQRHIPTLSPISSSRTEKCSPSMTSRASRTLIESEAATLRGQASIETDCSSRTLLGHNDTFDNSDMDELSFDH